MGHYEFHLMQLADSFFPSGSYGLSSGLEPFAKSGRIRNKGDVIRFARNQMKYQITPCDCAVLAAVMQAAKDNDLRRAVNVDDVYFSMKHIRAVRIASQRTGRQLLNTLVQITNDGFAKRFHDKVRRDTSPGMYPASLAVAANAMKIPAQSALRMFLYSYCASITGSAIRLGIISHVESQSVLMKLARDVNSAKVETGTELWQLTPITDILQMNHELDDLRMFNT